MWQGSNVWTLTLPPGLWTLNINQHDGASFNSTVFMVTSSSTSLSTQMTSARANSPTPLAPWVGAHRVQEVVEADTTPRVHIYWVLQQEVNQTILCTRFTLCRWREV